MSLSQALPKSEAGFSLASPTTRPDGVPLEKGEYSVASKALAVSSYFLSGALAINVSQVLGTPLYLINQDWYNAWIAFTKQSFGLLTMTLTQAFAPTKVIVSGDKSVRGQLQQAADGSMVLNFPDRIILMANHQIYTDWLYLWWIAYCNRMHGRLYIILKESLKNIPILGWGMQFSQFIFLKRNWEKDKPNMAAALRKLNQMTDPMWLLLFPEGTNLAPSTRERSAAWAKKTGISDMQHLLLPRSTGLQFCLEELNQTVSYLYDCTVAYEGVPRGEFAQDIFTLRAGYLEGRPPKSVSMHWRRFNVKDIPLHNQKTFDLWLQARWREKDILMEHYMLTGGFPADTGITKYKSGKVEKGCGHLKVEIRSSHWYEFLQIFAPIGGLALVLAAFYGALLPSSFWKSFNKGALKSSTDDIVKAGTNMGKQAKSASQSAMSLSMDDIFDANKQEESFKKGALAVQHWLNTPGAQSLLNKVDFVTKFIGNPEKAVKETFTGQQKTFMKDIAKEEQRRQQTKTAAPIRNVGANQGTFWKDLKKIENSRAGSVVSSAPSSGTATPTKTASEAGSVVSSRAPPKGTFWDDIKKAQKDNSTVMVNVNQKPFWERVNDAETKRGGSVATLSSTTSSIGTPVGPELAKTNVAPNPRAKPAKLKDRPPTAKAVAAVSKKPPPKLEQKSKQVAQTKPKTVSAATQKTPPKLEAKSKPITQAKAKT